MNPLQSLHEQGFVLIPGVLAAATPRQRRLPSEHEESVYD